VDAGLPIQPPRNYYPGDDPSLAPRVAWRAHGNLLYGNWLNYFVYQETPYDIKSVYQEKRRAYENAYPKGGATC